MNCCNNQEAITIVRANDTDFNGQHLLTLRISSNVLDLSDLSATFTLVDVQKTFEDLSSGEIIIDYSASETAEFPLGIIYGDLTIISKTGKIATIENRLAFNVISVVHGNAIAVNPYEYNINVEQGGENILNVLVEAGVSVEVGTTTTLPAGSDATVTNVGTQNHLVLNFGIPEGVQGEQGEQGDPALINGHNAIDLVAGNGIAITDNAGHIVISNTQISATWGNINGILSEQADLWGVLESKQDNLTATGGLTLSANIISGATLQTGIANIRSLIPSQATTQNQLADKDFVNSSINNMAAFYITSDAAGDPFATRAALIAGPYYFKGQLREPTQNDYALVSEDETHDDMTSRYMYDGTQWVWQYTLNNTRFTQAQIDAINSGITEALVEQIGTNQTAIQTINESAVMNSGITSTKVTQYDGYATSKQDVISDLATIRSGAAAGATAVQPAVLNNYVPTSRTVNGKALTSDISLDAVDVDAIAGVQINGTDLTPDTDNKVNIPVAGQNSLGVVATASNFGTAYSTALYLVKATDAEILAKTHNYKPIVPANLDKAVMEGLGNNALTWTDAYKTSARNTIAATRVAIVDWTD